MNGKLLIHPCLMLAPLLAFGSGVENVDGAWALESDPDAPCLVITNSTVWVKEAECWRPSIITDQWGQMCSFRRLEAATAVQEVFLAPKGWELKCVQKAGVQVKDGELVWLEEHEENNRCVYKNIRKMVRTVMPDWNTVTDESRYVGCWRPVRVRKGRQEKRDVKVEDGLLLKIREDRRLIIRNRGKSGKAKDAPFQYLIEKWLPLEGGLRFDYRERYTRSDDPVNCKVSGMWLDPSGNLLCYDWNEVMVMQRTDEVMDDPIDARHKMVEDKCYHGVWGVNREFNIKVFGFMSDGRGIRSGFIMMLPFNWTVREDGIIHCVCDEEFSLMVGSPTPLTFDCRYIADKNEMVVMERSKSTGGKLKETVLPYMDKEADVAEMLKESDKKKLDPNWQIRVEQLRRQAERTRTLLPEVDDLIGGWAGRDKHDALLIYLEKGGTGHAAGGMGIFEARWRVMDNGQICVMTPGYHGDLWKFYFERNPGEGQLVLVGKSMVDLEAAIEKPQPEAAEMAMRRFSEKENEQFKESLKQWKQQVEESEAKYGDRDQPPKMKYEEFFFSEERGIQEILDCFKQHGVISMWRQKTQANSISISKSHFPGLHMSVFLSGYVFGDEGMTSPSDSSISSGSVVDKVPEGAKLKSQGAEPEFVRKLIEVMKANGVKANERVVGYAKSYYSTFSKHVEFTIKEGDEEKILKALVEFMNANGDGSLMVDKWLPASK